LIFYSIEARFPFTAEHIDWHYTGLAAKGSTRMGNMYGHEGHDTGLRLAA